MLDPGHKMDTLNPTGEQHPTTPDDEGRKPYESPAIVDFGDIVETTGESAHSADY
jgi:hypothetical protein